MFEDQHLTYAEWKAWGVGRLGLSDSSFERTYPEEAFWSAWETRVKGAYPVIGDLDENALVEGVFFSECSGCGGPSHLTRGEQLAALRALDSASVVDRDAIARGEIQFLPKFGITREIATEVGRIIDKAGTTNLSRCEIYSALPDGVRVTAGVDA